MNKEDKVILNHTPMATSHGTFTVKPAPTGTRVQRRQHLQRAHNGKKAQSHMTRAEAQMAISVKMQIFGTGGKLERA